MASARNFKTETNENISCELTDWFLEAMSGSHFDP